MSETAELQRVQDAEHVKLLSIFFYISGAITALFALIPLIHVGLGTFLLVASGAARHADERVPMALIGTVLVMIGGTIIVVGELIAVLKMYTGYCLARRKNRTFCLVVAGISCLAFPYGTILGVFTMMVLLRDSVRTLFEEARTAPPGA